MVENRSEKGSNWSNYGAKSVQKRFKIGQNLIERRSVKGTKLVSIWLKIGRKKESNVGLPCNRN